VITRLYPAMILSGKEILMPARERRSEALAADHGDARREVNDSDGGQPPSRPTGEAPASLDRMGAGASAHM
jgi:hypothetical protein